MPSFRTFDDFRDADGSIYSKLPMEKIKYMEELQKQC